MMSQQAETPRLTLNAIARSALQHAGRTILLANDAAKGAAYAYVQQTMSVRTVVHVEGETFGTVAEMLRDVRLSTVEVIDEINEGFESETLVLHPPAFVMVGGAKMALFLTPKETEHV